jgi:hypothetical protein
MRRLLALTTINLVLGFLALGWLSWVVAVPRYWFPSAYAEKGPTGDQGPQGPRGPSGLPGPVGPGAATAVRALRSDLDDMASRVGALEATSEEPELRSKIDALEATLANLCDAIFLNYAESNSATEDLLGDLVTACP